MSIKCPLNWFFHKSSIYFLHSTSLWRIAHHLFCLLTNLTYNLNANQLNFNITLLPFIFCTPISIESNWTLSNLQFIFCTPRLSGELLTIYFCRTDLFPPQGANTPANWNLCLFYFNFILLFISIFIHIYFIWIYFILFEFSFLHWFKEPTHLPTEI